MKNLHDLQLPTLPADGQPAPHFTTLADCKRWLASVPITNTPLAGEQLLQQLECLLHHPLPATERLRILEFLRGTLHFLHDEWLRPHHRQRPELPLNETTQNSFATMQRLWQALINGYLRALQDWREQAAATPLDAQNQAQAALAACRALAAMQTWQLDHHRLGLMPPADFWRRLHRIYFAAEALAVSQTVVADTFSAAGHYVAILLLAAAQPHELQTKALEQVGYWAQRWAAKVPLLPTAPSDQRTPPLCINLASASAASVASVANQAPVAASDTLRWLDMHALRKTIKQRLLKLAAGSSPQELKLGPHCTQPDCERLLRGVYQDWCKGGRTAASDAAQAAPCELLPSVAAIHYQLSGKPFAPPRQSIYLGKRAHDELATFGHLTTQAAAIDQDQDAAQASNRSETWQQWAGRAPSLRLLQRPLAQAGTALGPGRLIALRPSPDSPWQLARIVWIASDSDVTAGSLYLAADLMPGTPQALTVTRSADDAGGMAAAKSEYGRGFHLPALAELGQPATLLLPGGWFRADQLLDIRHASSQSVRLDRLLDSGADFDRCTYTRLQT
ncbi:MAG: hypothetical protein KUL75_10645 [Sterolibacterium sp.]|nr:hypothetical protein [Sterolibacterium sp.]